MAIAAARMIDIHDDLFSETMMRTKVAIDANAAAKRQTCLNWKAAKTVNGIRRQRYETKRPRLAKVPAGIPCWMRKSNAIAYNWQYPITERIKQVAVAYFEKRINVVGEAVNSVSVSRRIPIRVTRAHSKSASEKLIACNRDMLTKNQ